MDKEKELQDSQKPEQDVILMDNEPKKEYSEVEKQLYARLKKAEEKIKAYENNPVPEPEPAKQESPQANSKVEQVRLDKLELKTDGYSADEADFILRNGGIKSKNDPFVKAAIESMRAKASVEQATPNPSTRSTVTETKNFHELSRAEKATKYTDAFQKALDRARKNTNKNI